MNNQLLCFARPTVSVARHVLPFRPNKYTASVYRTSSLLAALPLKEHLRLTYRGLEELLSLSGRLLRLLHFTCVPDHGTFRWFARRWISSELLAAALADTVRRVPFSPKRRQVALDSTGLWLTDTSRYFEWRSKRERVQRAGPAGDFPDLIPLTTQAAAVMPFDEVLADAGYDSEANHRFCRGSRRAQPHPCQEAAVRARCGDHAGSAGDAPPPRNTWV